MVSVALAAVLVAVSASSDPVLLDFTAPWCGPCRSMEPALAQLSASGYPIRKVNIEQQRELANQFGINQIPCFVLVQGGRELGRIVGPASTAELRSLFSKASQYNSTNNVRGQSPEEPLRRIAPNSAGHQRLLGDGTLPLQTALLNDARPPARTMPVANPSPDAANPFRRASSLGDQRDTPGSTSRPQSAGGAKDLIKYAARLKIEDQNGSSYGTGTIIDVRGDQALILTCGHIFRESRGQGTVFVDLFVPGAPKKLPGRVVSFNLERDVALVSVRPGVPIAPARVAQEGYHFQNGDQVLSVGCNNGAEPTVEESQVIAIDKFVGPPNVQVAGQPAQGRSGGGLFTPDGTVIGVCNASDPKDDAGLYAAAAAIHQELDAARLSSIYRNSAASSEQLAESERETPVVRGASPSAPGLQSPAGSSSGAPPMTAAERTTVTDLQNRSDAEVICIVRPRDGAQTKSEVIVLDRASSVFLDQLDAERHSQQSGRFTSLDVRRAENDWRKTR